MPQVTITPTATLVQIARGDAVLDPTSTKGRLIRGPACIRTYTYADGGRDVQVSEFEGVIVTVPARYWTDVVDRDAHRPSHADDLHLVILPDQVCGRTRAGVTLRLTVAQAQNLRDDAAYIVNDVDRATVPRALVDAARRAQAALILALTGAPA